MKTQIILMLAILILGSDLAAQTNYSNQSMDNALIVAGHNFCSDRVFIHTDRNCYSTMDTIHFQAYIRNMENGVFESSSPSLYVLLFNEQKEIADSSRFKIENSTSSGWMHVPLNAEPGKYRLVAYTGTMQNYNPENAFKLDLKVDSKFVGSESASVKFNKETYMPGDTVEANIKAIDSKKHPIQNKKFTCNLKSGNKLYELDINRTDENGEAITKFVIPDSNTDKYELQVEMNRNADQVYFKKNFNIPFRAQYIDLSILPESGTLVEGVEQRIGFNAVNINGQPVFIEGLIKNKAGNVLDTIKSGTYGAGLFTCTPAEGMYIELINGDYEKKIWPLPPFDKSDLCMSVKTLKSKSIAIELQSNKYTGESVFVKGIINGNQILFLELKLDKKRRIVLNTTELPTGAIQINLFDNEMKPVAQRLVYINADKRLKFKITSDTSIYKPGQETELTVSVTDSMGKPETGFFSISAVNCLTGYDPEIFSPGIDYTFNYYPYFKQNLPTKVLIDGFENITDEQRDILLMVYGWSKIHTDEENKEFVNYDVLNMKALYGIKSLRSYRPIDLVSIESLSRKHLFTNDNGEVSFPIDSLDNITRTVVVLPDEESKKKVLGVSLSIPANQLYAKSNLMYNSLPVIPKTENISLPEIFSFNESDSTIAISEVTIKGRIEREFDDKYEALYQINKFGKMISYEQLWSCRGMLDAICQMVTPYRNDISLLFLRPPLKRGAETIFYPSYFILDDRNSNWIEVKSIRPCDLQFLIISGHAVILKRRPDDPQLNERYANWLMKTKKDKLYTPFKLYRYRVEFYNPSKAEMDSNPLIQERPTIYWKPEVFFDGKGPVKIKFPNNYRPGPVMVTVNGVSSNSLVGAGKFTYKVQNSFSGK